MIFSRPTTGAALGESPSRRRAERYERGGVWDQPMGILARGGSGSLAVTSLTVAPLLHRGTHCRHW